MPFLTGLVSISFRRHTVEELIAACREAGLSLIEWGSDVHVPAGNAAIADEVAAKTAAAGLRCATYGSYFRLGQHTPAEFAPYVDSARRLGARIIRVWGGTKGSADLTGEERSALVRDAREIAEMAAAQGLTVALECHGGTVTDHIDSAIGFYSEVDHPALRAYWQPNQCYDFAYNRAAAERTSPLTEAVHVFHWSATARYPLADGAADWMEYLKILQPMAEEKDLPMLLEFMHDDRLETLAETARVLNTWVKK